MGVAPKIIMAKEVEKLRAFKRMIYRDALAVVRALNGEVDRKRATNNNYSKITKKLPASQDKVLSSANKLKPLLEMKSVEVQTDPIPSIEDKTEVLKKTLVTQLTVLIISLMKINTNNPDEITNLIKQTTGVEVDKSLFKGERRDLASNSAAAGSIQQCNMEKTLQKFKLMMAILKNLQVGTMIGRK